MRPAIRLSALMRLPVVWVFTHDSIGVGEDGPTHQPVEHYAALRAIPGLTVIRPADANETARAWVAAFAAPGPVCLLLTRQDVPVVTPGPDDGGDAIDCGGYVLAETSGRAPDAVIVATGSEVAVALDARAGLARRRGRGSRSSRCRRGSCSRRRRPPIGKRSCPSGWPPSPSRPGSPRVGSATRTARSRCERFGASAPGPEVFTRLGLTAEAVADAVARLLADRELNAAPGATRPRSP